MLVTEHRLASERAFFVLFLKEQKLLSANALRKIKKELQDPENDFPYCQKNFSAF